MYMVLTPGEPSYNFRSIYLAIFLSKIHFNMRWEAVARIAEKTKICY